MIDQVLLRNSFTEELRLSFSLLKKQNIQPRIFILSIGESVTTKIISEKMNLLGNELGVNTDITSIVESFTEGEILKIIEEVNNNPYVQGIFLNIAPSTDINTQRIYSHIHFMKDVAFVTPLSSGMFVTSSHRLMPPEIIALPEFVKASKVDLRNLSLTILGGNDLLSKLLAVWLIKEKIGFRFINSDCADTNHATDLLIITSAIDEWSVFKAFSPKMVIDLTLEGLSEELAKETFKDANFISFKKSGIYELCIFSNLLETALLFEKPKI